MAGSTSGVTGTTGGTGDVVNTGSLADAIGKLQSVSQQSAALSITAVTESLAVKAEPDAIKNVR